jgi:hypothetical protein
MKTIPLTGQGGVMSLMNKPGAVFAIKFRKVNGDASTKIGCMLSGSGNALTEHKRSNRGGMVKLFQPATNRLFDVYLDTLVEFNGITIFHPY